MKEEYKGYTISYIEHLGEFEAQIDESEYRNEALAKVKKYIDNLQKEDFERTDVFVDSYRSDYDEAVVTSEVHHYGDYEVWVTFKEDKRRQKCGARAVFIDNEENRNIIADILKCDKEIEDLTEKKGLLRATLEKYVAKMKTLRNV